MSAKNSRQESGFTLVELMIVLTVVGILTAVSIPIVGSYREKALIARGQMGANCLQTALKGMGGLSSEVQNATLRELGGSTEQFYLAAEGLGCRLGPTPTSPNAQRVLSAPGDGCVKYICVDGEWLEVPCDWPDNGDPGCDPIDPCPDTAMTFRIPEVSGKQIYMTSSSIEVQPVQ